jgi:ATP/maltotriose-dependent transcriptional regulator MalT
MLGRGLPLDDLDRAIELEARASETEPSRSVAGRVTTISGQWLRYVDDFAGARARLEEPRRQAVEEGDESALPNILAHLAQTELWSGNWPLAGQYADESCVIAEQLGLTFGMPPAFRAQVDAHLGRIDRARQTAVEGLEVARRSPLAAPLYLRVLGFLELSLGESAAAERQLTRALEHTEEVRILEPGVLRIHADAVEALVRIGDLERAEAVLLQWEKQARRLDLPWSLATSARCRGMLESARGRADRALASIERPLVDHERLPMPFERGRTLLVKGQIERRVKRRAAAKQSLENALVIFERLGAPLWVETARAELARIGLRHAAEGLTESERRVAELAASGLTNRQVAAQLFMSPKTVEANLARLPQARHPLPRRAWRPHERAGP